MTISNSKAYAAAVRLLKAHLNTRPATEAEASAIHAELIAKAEASEKMASEASSAQDALELRDAASRLRLQARAWEGNPQKAWDETTQALEERIEHYESLLRS